MASEVLNDSSSSLQVRQRVETKTDESFSLTLEPKTLINLLNAVRKPGEIRIPDDAYVYVDVPGGGDWSMMDLDLRDCGGLKVRWTRTYTTTKESE